MSLSKSSALAKAKQKIYIFPFSGKGWTMVCPWDYSRPDGPCTEIQCQDFWQARSKQKAARLELALVLMGVAQEQAQALRYEWEGESGSLEDQISQCLES